MATPPGAHHFVCDYINSPITSMQALNGSTATPVLVNKDTAILAFHFRQYTSTTAADMSLTGITAFRVSLKSARGTGGTLYSFQDTYNAGLYTEYEDLSEGKVTVALALTESALNTAFTGDADQQISAFLEVAIVDASGYPRTLLSVEVTVINQLDDGAPGTPPPSSPTYYTATEVLNLFDARTWKPAVRAASTANVADLTTLITGASFGGVTLAEGDPILLRHQSTGSQNGSYVVANSGAPARRSDLDTGDSAAGAVVYCYEGTNAGKIYTCTNADGSDVVGTDALTFTDPLASYQPLDADLTALAALSSTGILARTASDTYALRTITGPAAGITVTNGDGVSGNPTISLANDLDALEGQTGTGLVARTADDTYARRTITGPAAGISVSNGDGVSGNPTLALANDLAALEGLSSAGLIARTGDGTAEARTVTGTANEIDVADGDGVSGNPTIGIADNPVLPGTEGVTIPAGTTAQRPGSPNAGEMRWNTSLTRAEVWDGSSWTAVGGGVTAVSVTDIDDPSTELNALAGAAKGELIVVYETAAGTDEWTIYAWDDADSGAESVPTTVDGSSGMWVAIAGTYGTKAANVSVAASASNYTAASADVEAHLAGIDTQLGTIGTGGYKTSSASSLAIGTGSKAFTVASGLQYQEGARVRAASDADASNYMEGIVASYSGTTLTVTVDNTGGSGTYADWLISIAGDVGPAGDPRTELGRQWAFFHAGAFIPRETNGATLDSEELDANDIMREYYLFDGATEQAIQAALGLEDWDAGAIIVRPVWDAAAGATAGDGVVWGIRAGSYADDDAMDAAFGTEATSADVLLAVGDNHKAPAATVTIGGSPAAGDLLVLQIARKVGNASDDMVEDAKLLGIWIQWALASSQPASY